MYVYNGNRKRVSHHSGPWSSHQLNSALDWGAFQNVLQLLSQEATAARGVPCTIGQVTREVAHCW